MLHTTDLTTPEITGYTLDSTADLWPQKVKFTLPGLIFTYLGFPECPSVTFIPGFVMLMVLD